LSEPLLGFPGKSIKPRFSPIFGKASGKAPAQKKAGSAAHGRAAGRRLPGHRKLGRASAVLIIAEPSISDAHDMERVDRLAAGFNIPAMVAGKTLFEHDGSCVSAGAVRKVWEKVARRL